MKKNAYDPHDAHREELLVQNGAPIIPMLDWGISDLKSTCRQRTMPGRATPLEMRYAAGMTQKAFAKAIGISLRRWQYIEKGERTLSYLEYNALRWILMTTTDNSLGTAMSVIKYHIEEGRERLKKEQARHLLRPKSGFVDLGVSYVKKKTVKTTDIL